MIQNKLTDKKLEILSQLHLPTNQAFTQSHKRSARNSLGSRTQFGLGNNDHSIMLKVKQIESRVVEIQKRLDTVLMKINQLSKSQNNVSQSQKLYTLEKKYQKVQYMIWEIKQLEKQNKNLVQNLSSTVFEHKQLTNISFKKMKQNNQTLLNSIEETLIQVFQKVEQNKSHVKYQVNSMCDAIEDLCVIQSKQNTAQKPIHHIQQPFTLNRSFFENQSMQRKSLPNKCIKINSQRKSLTHNKKRHIKQQYSLL